jgi:hypothetical protein
MTFDELLAALQAEYPDLNLNGDGTGAIDVYRGKRRVTTYFVGSLLGWKTEMPDGSNALDVAKRDLDTILNPTPQQAHFPEPPSTS